MSLIKKTLKERTREYILKLVQEQKLNPGDKLPAQREIAQTLKNPGNPWYGVDFEATIPALVSALRKAGKGIPEV